MGHNTQVCPRVSVRGADRDVKGCVGVAQGRGEDILRPQVSARVETRDLHLIRAITRLSSCVYQRGDRVVSARLPRNRLRVQGTGSRGEAQRRRRRTESTYSSGSTTAP